MAKHNFTTGNKTYVGLVKVGEYSPPGWAWEDIHYDTLNDKFYRAYFEACGCDLSGDKYTGSEEITEEDALAHMTDKEKAYLAQIREEMKNEIK